MQKHPTLSQYEKLKEVEEKTGYSKVFFFLAGVLVMFVLLLLVGGFKLIADLSAFVYPAYMSFKAIDSKEMDDTQWLTYWVVFSAFSIIEQVAGFLTSFIPFYYFIKTAFMIWLYHPKFLGAQLIYKDAIRPLLMPYLNISGTPATTKKTT
uniref:Receptor expression-enhancing protein n=1 Tax=Grammatophora oceanica TaxID=210454 RepID=A0A7S1V0B5_9STRA|mmetsp:Transcript_31943/g.47482  ORF Transcript_31943/g.47482 Transcript_31943/m.47482 type:complete len:151 (+) Transcript_31943:1-453(+)